MHPIRSLLILSLAVFSPIAYAAEMIEVDSIKFNKTRDDWIQMEIQLSCDGNPLPDAKNDRFLDDIKVTAYVTYSNDGAESQFTYYKSDLEIITMEKGDRNNVYFYMPGLVVERDRLKNDPDYYYVELSVGDNLLPPQKNAMSSSISNQQILDSMLSNAQSEAEANQGIFMPVYLAPAAYLGRVSDLPTLRRYDYKPQ